MKITIFTEAGRGIGMGHLSRCAGLAQAFRERGVQCQLLVYGDRNISRQLDVYGGDYKNWMSFQRQQPRCDIAIVDSYLASKKIFQKIQNNSAVSLYFDDNNRIKYPKGIIINGAINADQLNYGGFKHFESLLGPQYVSLRREFWDVPEKKVRAKAKKILITFGGTDEANMTSKILGIFDRKYPLLQKIVIIGKNFIHKKDILKQKSKNIKFVFESNAKQMSRIMQDVDFAVSAGGQTLNELARCGCAAVIVVVADNQERHAKAWAKTKCFFYVGKANDKNFLSQIDLGLNKVSSLTFRRLAAQRGPQTVDGQGAKRIVAACVKSYVEQHIKIRHVEEKDIKSIFELSNQPMIRQGSFAPRKITWPEHQKWFAKTLSDPKTLFLVAYAKDDLLGQIRFCIQKKKAVVSISVDPLFQQCGIGKKIFEDGIRFLYQKRIDKIIAYIKSDNTSSQEFFKSLGFERIKSREDLKKKICMQFTLKK
ncbi:MAG: GNAT family N-acetyltransferase [Candidatus Omnitrophota bacterium]